MALLASCTPHPTDLISIENAAKCLGRSRRTLDRWAARHPDEIPRYPHTAPDGSVRTLVSWRDVETFCINHNRPLSSDNPSDLSETSSDTCPTLSEDVFEPNSILSETVSDRSEGLSDAVSDRVGQVSELTTQLTQLSATLEATRSAHRREVSLLEARIAELKDSHRREVTNLQDELTARRGEASEMRQAAERQQQREAALRWQTATMKGERDSAITELRIWSGSSWYQRLMSRPRLPAASGALTTNQPALFDVTSHDE